jgi:diguanylate cyclase
MATIFFAAASQPAACLPLVHILAASVYAIDDQTRIGLGVTETDAFMQGPSGPTIAAETLEIMRLHGVAATGANYEVWLAYRIGRNAQLREAVDAHIASGETFTSEFNAELYDKFFSSLRASAEIVLAGEKLARDLSTVISFLKSTEAKSDDYGRALESAATDLGRGLDPEQIRNVVSSLAAATLDMANHNQRLSEQLQKSTREIDALRKNLESARVQSLTDSLTGLANRRMFDETLNLRLIEARAERAEMCLLMCDIDHFKRFNDTWGHHTGDQILRFLASALQAHARPDSLVARYGGEEFALVMPRTTLKEAETTADALRKAIQTKRLRRRSTNEDLGQVTISIGVARLQAGDTAQALVARADACLYSSKRNGRNRTTCDSAPVLYVA